MFQPGAPAKNVCPATILISLTVCHAAVFEIHSNENALLVSQVQTRRRVFCIRHAGTSGWNFIGDEISTSFTNSSNENIRVKLILIFIPRGTVFAITATISSSIR